MSAMGKRFDKKSRLRHSEQGVAVVEFAILAALFLTIVLGLLEFGIMFFQKHYIAGAAREGVRVGVIANNYECYSGCDVARQDAVFDSVTDYLGAVFDSEDINFTLEDIERTPPVGTASDSVLLSVRVEVDNFMPEMISGLVPGYDRPETFTHTATGAYEDPNEL